MQDRRAAVVQRISRGYTGCQPRVLFPHRFKWNFACSCFHKKTSRTFILVARTKVPSFQSSSESKSVFVEIPPRLALPRSAPPRPAPPRPAPPRPAPPRSVRWISELWIRQAAPPRGSSRHSGSEQVTLIFAGGILHSASTNSGSSTSPATIFKFWKWKTKCRAQSEPLHPDSVKPRSAVLCRAAPLCPAPLRSWDFRVLDSTGYLYVE